MLLSYLLKCGLLRPRFQQGVAEPLRLLDGPQQRDVPQPHHRPAGYAGRAGHRGAAIASDGSNPARRVLRRVHASPEQATNRKNASLIAARGELARLTKQRENIIQAIKDGVPATEVKDDLARLVTRREELEALLAGTKEEPVLLHPSMAAEYRRQVANLAQVLSREENRGEAADILRSLVDRIELRPNQRGKLEIDLYGDLAGILTLAGKKDRPLNQNDQSVQQVKVVAGVGFEPTTFRL
jgi:hypothetical protein